MSEKDSGPHSGEDSPFRGEFSPTKDGGEVTLKDLRRRLEDDKPPTDEREDIGTDRDGADYSLNSSISDEEEQHINPEGSTHGKLGMSRFAEMVERTDGSRLVEGDPSACSDKKSAFATADDAGAQPEDEHLSFDDIEDVISNPYAEMPEFYSKQIEFEPVEGLPGNQRKQLDHKKKTVLKNKYWDRVLKNVYDMATAKVPRPTHLVKMLSLYIINQEKVKEQKKDVLQRSEEKTSPERMKKLSNAALRKTIGAPFSLSEVKRNNVSMGRRNDRKDTLLVASTGSSISRKPSNLTPSTRLTHGLTAFALATNVASNEVQKRAEKMEKNNVKVNIEELARESKNLLIRMPPYKKKESDTFTTSDIDTTYSKLLTKYVFTHGFVKRWKGE